LHVWSFKKRIVVPILAAMGKRDQFLPLPTARPAVAMASSVDVDGVGADKNRSTFKDHSAPARASFVPAPARRGQKYLSLFSTSSFSARPGCLNARVF